MLLVGVEFSPCWCGKIVDRGVLAPKSQTASTKSATNGLFRRSGLHFGQNSVCSVCSVCWRRARRIRIGY